MPCTRARTQGSALRVRTPLELLDEVEDRGEVPLLVALDGVTDPANLGAIIRSTAAFGGQGVIVPQRRSVGMTASAWKTSAGAAARVPVAMAGNLTTTLKELKNRGVFVVGLDGGGDVSLPGSTSPRGDRHRRGQRGQGPVAPRHRDVRRRRVDPDRVDDGIPQRRHRRERHALRDREAPRRGLTFSGLFARNRGLVAPRRPRFGQTADYGCAGTASRRSRLCAPRSSSPASMRRAMSTTWALNGADCPAPPTSRRRGR